MPSLFISYLDQTWVYFSVVAMLVALTRLRFHLGNNDTLVYFMFWFTCCFNKIIYALIGTWRTTQENSATTILNGSDLG